MFIHVYFCAAVALQEQAAGFYWCSQSKKSLFILMTAVVERCILVSNQREPVKTELAKFIWYLTFSHGYIMLFTFFNKLPIPTTSPYSCIELQVFHLIFLSNQLKLVTMYFKNGKWFISAYQFSTEFSQVLVEWNLNDKFSLINILWPFLMYGDILYCRQS